MSYLSAFSSMLDDSLHAWTDIHSCICLIFRENVPYIRRLVHVTIIKFSSILLKFTLKIELTKFGNLHISKYTESKDLPTMEYLA